MEDSIIKLEIWLIEAVVIIVGALSLAYAFCKGLDCCSKKDDWDK